MGKDSASDLFVNDGSFMEKFKQLQQGKREESPREEPKSSVSSSSMPLRTNTTNTFLIKKPLDVKTNDVKKPSISTSGGKLAFSLKQKSKVSVAPVKLGADEDELEEDAENGPCEVSAKRQKLGLPDAFGASSGHGNVAYVLIVYQHWWKEILVERVGKCGSNLLEQ
uniref:SURP and G-patch domain-containing protein 1-like protein n=1 Tax=Anthurium amnicola TaxID=1678845 RepID=A0A1D1Z4K2_9ARAE